VWSSLPSWGPVAAAAATATCRQATAPAATPAHRKAPFFACSQRLLDRNMFAFFLSPLGSDESSVIFGAVDPALHVGSIHWIPTRPSVYWEVDMAAVLIDGQPQGFCLNAGNSRNVHPITPQHHPWTLPRPRLDLASTSSRPRLDLVSTSPVPTPPFPPVLSPADLVPFHTYPSPPLTHHSVGCRVAIDTGTSLFAGPAAHIQTLSRVLRRAMGTTCSLSSMPVLEFEFQGLTLRFEPADYVLHMADSLDHCALAFMPLDVPPPRGPLWVFGDVFLRKYYTVFDRDQRRIGVALASHGRPAGRMHLSRSSFAPMAPGLPQQVERVDMAATIPKRHQGRERIGRGSQTRLLPATLHL